MIRILGCSLVMLFVLSFPCRLQLAQDSLPLPPAIDGAPGEEALPPVDIDFLGNDFFWVLHRHPC